MEPSFRIFDAPVPVSRAIAHGHGLECGLKADTLDPCAPADGEQRSGTTPTIISASPQSSTRTGMPTPLKRLELSKRELPTPWSVKSRETGSESVLPPPRFVKQLSDIQPPASLTIGEGGVNAHDAMSQQSSAQGEIADHADAMILMASGDAQHVRADESEHAHASDTMEFLSDTGVGSSFGSVPSSVASRVVATLKAKATQKACPSRSPRRSPRLCRPASATVAREDRDWKTQLRAPIQTSAPCAPHKQRSGVSPRRCNSSAATQEDQRSEVSPRCCHPSAATQEDQRSDGPRRIRPSAATQEDQRSDDGPRRIRPSAATQEDRRSSISPRCCRPSAALQEDQAHTRPSSRRNGGVSSTPSRSQTPRCNSPTSRARSPRPVRVELPPLEQLVSSVMLALKNGLAPGARDKCKVMQMFHDSLPRSSVRVDLIERAAGPEKFADFAEKIQHSFADCQVGFFIPDSRSKLTRIRDEGYCDEDVELLGGDVWGVPVGLNASVAHERAMTKGACFDEDSGDPDQKCMCVLVLGPGATRVGAWQCGQWKGYPVTNLRELLISHIVWYKCALKPVGDEPCPAEQRRQAAKRQQEYAKVRDALLKQALHRFEGLADHDQSTTVLPSSSAEAESVISLYLLGGGGQQFKLPPGVEPREAIGSVVVSRLYNRDLFKQYSELIAEKDFENGAMKSTDRGTGTRPRYREDVVWHGARLKRVDGEGMSLAGKIQSIAEQGLDPLRCAKGAAAEGGIWVAVSPLAAFGQGCDGLVAFILCVTKTRFNEWMDSNCARVLKRERVLPLYSLVHAV